MKKNISILVSVALLSLIACTKNFEAINTNPNVPVKVPYKTLLTNALNSSVRAGNSIFVVDWVRYEARVIYNHNDKYQLEGSLTQSMFSSAYSGYLKDLSLLEKQALALDDKNTAAVAMIITAYAYQGLTDLFGDIPYSEALQGDAAKSLIFPKYDSQESIYADLIEKLKAANQMINPTANIGSADILFNGNMMKWKKFANSLLLRLYMRISRVKPAIAEAGIKTIMSNPATYPIISSGSEAAFLRWPANDANYRSPSWINPANLGVQQVVMENIIVEFLKDRNDPRLSVYAEPVPGTTNTYKGLPLGTDQESVKDYSLTGLSEFHAPGSPARIMRYAEVMFILAEAALNGWNVGMSAEQAYNAAIKASFDEYGLSIGTYLSHPKVNFNGGTPQRELIGDQKWASLFLDGPEAWADIRRTGYPVYVATTEPLNTLFPGKGVIKRMPYPLNEFVNNRESVDAALSAQPGILDGKFGAGVWWDVN